MDLIRASATEISRAIRQREVSSREVLDALVARVEEVNPSINAVVALDLERAQVAAAAADEATAGGGELGPLHGLPMTVKDVWETEGLVTTSGAPELKDHVPTTDAAGRRTAQAGRRDRLRQDQHAALRRRPPDVQRGLRASPTTRGT